MSARDQDEPNRTSSPLELLFDLTFVVAVAQVADEFEKQIESGHALQSIVPFIMAFFAIWWAWMNFTWFASAYDSDDVQYRLLVLLQMGGVLVLAAGVPAAFEHENFFGITLGYFIMRIGLVAQWVRAAIENPDGRTTALRYAVGVTIIQLLWLARLLLPTDGADQWWTVYTAFAVLAVLEGVVPYWAERTGMTTWHPHHIAERYGLFAIILLGETIAALAVGNNLVATAGTRVGPLVAVGISALVLVFALWWMYFLQPTGEGLTVHRDASFYWGFGHYFIFAALGALGAGLEVLAASASGHSDLRPDAAAWAVAVPVAIYIAALLVTNVRILPGIVVHLWIVVPTVVIVLLLPLLTLTLGLPVTFALIAAVVAASVAATMTLGRRMVGVES
jgi:low temperature requirement protein LtrA